MRFLESRLPTNTGLERRIDTTASELVACLVLPATTPVHSSQPAQLIHEDDSPLGTVLMQIATCSFSPTFCAPPEDAASPSVPASEHAGISSSHVAALKDSVLLLRLRKEMLQVYTGIQSPAVSAEGFMRWAEHVGELRNTHAARLSAPLLRGVWASTLVELGAMQQVLLVQAMLPRCRPRETLLALAIAHTELSRLSTPERVEARERALLVVANASSLGSGLGSRTGPQLAATTKASPEPALFRFLRTLCGALVGKAALYFNGLLGAPALTANSAAITSSGGGLGPAAPTTDYSQLINSFVQRSGALLAALLLQAKGLSLRVSAGGAVYTCCEDEAKLCTQSALGEAPWPVLFMQPEDGPLAQLWPCIKRIISERQELLKHGEVYVQPQVVTDVGGECTFWLYPCDPRVVLVIAFSGRKRASDRAVLEFLRALGELRGPQIVGHCLRKCGLGQRA
eukprot:3727340-Prymnesium_polylepis.1